MLKNVDTPEDIRASFRVFAVLRPHLTEDDFVAQVLRQYAQGYRITVTIDDGVMVAAVGYRHMEILVSGKIIYIDDLITHPDARGKGYGGKLLNYVRDLAREEGLDAVELHSGHHRHTAHRLYLNSGYEISSHHFKQRLKPHD